MSQIKENEGSLENSCHGGQSIASKENSETVMEEDESYAKSATHSGSAPPATEKALGCTLEHGGGSIGLGSEGGPGRFEANKA